ITVIGSNPVPATNILKGRSVTYWSAFFYACHSKKLCAQIVPGFKNGLIQHQWLHQTARRVKTASCFMQHKHFDSCDFKGGTCSDQVFILHYQGSERSLPICREPAAFELMLDRTVRRGMREGLAFADKLLPPALAGWGLRGALYGLRTCNCESRRRHWHSALQQLRHCHC
ncbi:MAG: hypothetical protein Q8S08_09020, partial [Halomonas sp.]